MHEALMFVEVVTQLMFLLLAQVTYSVQLNCVSFLVG